MSTSPTPERRFKHFEDLPPELRMLIIDEMQPDDRCLLRRCSKTSDKEARASKNFIYGLELSRFSYDYKGLYITVSHEKHSSFHLEFEKDEKSGQKYMIQVKIRNEEGNIEMWRVELDQSIDLVEHAEKQFIKLVKMYQNNVKSLIIREPEYLQNHIFAEIDCLPNLEALQTRAKDNIPHILSLTRKPLRELFIVDGEPENILAECEQIYKIRDSIYSGGTQFTNSQFLRLSASQLWIHMGSMTPDDIHSFVTSWQDGTIGKDISCHTWNLNGLKFDIDRFMQLFRLNPYRFRGELEIKHLKEDKVARLSCSSSRITFSCIQR